jgi:lipoic acid synthetase
VEVGQRIHRLAVLVHLVVQVVTGRAAGVAHEPERRAALELLARADARRRRTGSPMKTKSGVMAGLGETMEELLATLRDLRDAGCDIATVGQYLQPYEKRLPVERYYTPDEFERIRFEGEAMGFQRVESGPLVRSSYHARRALEPADGRRETGDGPR